MPYSGEGPVTDIDVETTGLQYYAHEMFMFSYLGDDDKTAGVWRHPEDRERIQRVLDRPGRFRAWNSGFDRSFLNKAGYTLAEDGRWDDGMVMAHIMDERRSVALKFRGASMFGEDERDLDRIV